MPSPAAESENCRYIQLLSALYSGDCPDWVPRSQRDRLRIASDGHVLVVSETLATVFPSSSFYARALLGTAFLDGVIRNLVCAPQVRRSLSEKIVVAAREWGRVSAPPSLAQMMAYDHWRHAPISAYTGSNRDELARREKLPDEFELKRFEYSVLDFARVIERFQRTCAPPELVARYAPKAQPTHIAKFRESGQVYVREVEA